MFLFKQGSNNEQGHSARLPPPNIANNVRSIVSVSVVLTAEVLVCGISADRNRVPMREEFSKSNLLSFARHFLNASLPVFLHSGKIDLGARYQVKTEDDLAQQVDAHELVQETTKAGDRVFLLLGRQFTRDKNEQLLVDAFFSASKILNKELDFVWLSLAENEIAPHLLGIFTGEKTGKTAIWVKSDRTVKFSPVTAGNNLPGLLIRFIRQRKSIVYH